MTWIDVNDALPEMQRGEKSEPVFVLTGEFGQPRCILIAQCWVSSRPQAPKWYVDHLRCIADRVTHWKPLPEFFKVKP